MREVYPTVFLVGIIDCERWQTIPPQGAATSAPAPASRSLPAASTVARATTPPSPPLPRARRSAPSPAASGRCRRPGHPTRSPSPDRHCDRGRRTDVRRTDSLCVGELHGYADRLCQVLTQFRLLAEPRRIETEDRKPEGFAEQANWMEARARAVMEPGYRRPSKANNEMSLIYGAILSTMR
jgi:hypothetical protein